MVRLTHVQYRQIAPNQYGVLPLAGDELWQISSGCYSPGQGKATWTRRKEEERRDQDQAVVRF